MIYYRFASHEDNQQLLDLTSSASMAGDMALCIDRKPDFFRLLNLRGESRVFVAADENNNIIGSLSVSLQQVYIGGRIYPVHYVGDFRVAVPYRGRGIGVQLCNQLTGYMLSVDADLVFLTVAKGNSKPFSFFKGRPDIPDFRNVGTFLVHQFIGSSKNVSAPGYVIEKNPVSQEILQILNDHYRQYALGSLVTGRKLENTVIYQIRKNNEIMGIMSLADTMDIKQNIVKKLPPHLKYLLQLLNCFSKLFGISKMPGINEPVTMIYIKYLWVKNNDKAVLRLLVGKARRFVYEKAYSFACLGLHEKDPLNRKLSGMRKLTFHSIGMFLSMKSNEKLMNQVLEGIPFEDYSLV